MRIIFLFFCLSVAVFGEDWTVNGTTYHNVKVLKVEADAVTILDDDGGAMLNLSDLSATLQKRFNYDPAAAKIAADERAKADAENAEALQQEMNQADEIQKQKQIADAEQITEAQQAQPVQKTGSNVFIASHSSHGGTVPVPVYSSAPSGPSAEEIEMQKEKQAEESQRQADQIYQGRLKIISGIMPELEKLFSKEQIKTFTEAVVQNQICVGMPKILVILAWGDPESDTTSTSGDGDDWETMDYGNFSSMVFLDGGIVKNITQTQTADSTALPRPIPSNSSMAVGGGL